MTPPAATTAGRRSTSPTEAGKSRAEGHRRKLRFQAPERRVSGPASGRTATAPAKAAGTAAPTRAPRISRPAKAAGTAAPTRAPRISRPRQAPRIARPRRAPTQPLGARALAFARSLPDHVVLDRVLRGRSWIPLLGVMLAGIVAMQVEVLKYGASMGRSIQRGTALASKNEQLRASVASLADQQRIESLAANMGMVMPAPTGVSFLAPQAANVERAIANIHTPNGTAFLAQLAQNNASNAAAVAPARPAGGVTTALGTTGTGTTALGTTALGLATTGTTGTGTTGTTGTGTTARQGATSGGASLATTSTTSSSTGP